MDKVVTSEVLMGGNFNGHVGSDVGGFGEVHGGLGGIGQVNDGGIRLLDWVVGKALHLINTCFQKKKSWLIKFRSSETETMIDYILVNKKNICQGKSFSLQRANYRNDIINLCTPIFRARAGIRF